MHSRVRLLLLTLFWFSIQDFANAQGFAVVEAKGEASYRIPIVVPPGPAGHQPDLALVYASGTGRGPAGWLGLDWTLSGESRVERATRASSPWDFENQTCGAGSLFPCYRSDYALDGQDLVCSSGTCSTCTSSSPCRYRTQSDDGRTIEFLGDTSGWRIADRDGRVSTYGAASSGAGRLVNSSTTTGEVFSWQIESSTDVSGNVIRYVWDTTSTANIAYLKRIEYGQGEAANRGIEFILNDPVSAPRLDKPVWVRAGFRQQMDRRVAAIEVRAASDELVTKYVLAYTQDPDSLRSRLASVTRVGSDEQTSLPAYAFSYSERTAGDGFEQTNQPGFYSGLEQCPPLGGNHSDPSGNGFRNIADLNRDGLADLYFVRDYRSISVTGQTEVALGTGTRFLPGVGLSCSTDLMRGSLWSEDRLFFTSTESSDSIQISRSATLDLDGDGYFDHLDQGGSYLAGSFSRVPRGLRLGSANGFSATTLLTSMELPHLWDFEFGNGWNADDFWIRIATWRSGYFDTRALLVDVTGDGRPDLLATRGASAFDSFGFSDAQSTSPVWPSWTGWAVFANRGLKTAASGETHLDFGDVPVLFPASSESTIETVSLGITRTAFVDQNGDGLPDRFTLNGVEYGYGAGLLPLHGVENHLSYDLVAAPLYVAVGLYDLNGDGFLDHVAKQNASSDPYWHVHFGTGDGFNPSESLFRRVIDILDEAALESDGTHVGPRSIRDVNGDGRLDYVAAGRGSVFLQVGVANHDGERTEPLAGLLTRAVDPLGGTVEFSYAMSGQFQTADGLPANPGMALLKPVVTRVTRGDGRPNTPEVVSTYRYEGGVFDYAEKEFRGFGTVVETTLEAGAEALRTKSSYLTDRICAFYLVSREIAAGESVFERESTSYLQVAGGGASASSQWGRCLPSARIEEAVEGDEQTRRARRTSWDYGQPIDASYNVAKLEEWGEWDLQTNQDVPGDERFTEFGYAAASDPHPSIVSRVNSEVVKDAAGNVYSKREFCYAGAGACGSAGNGLPRVVTAYLTDYMASPPVIDSPRTVATIAYDVFGNPTQRTGAVTPDDADGLGTTIRYDDTYQTFPAEIQIGADVAPPLRPLLTSFAWTGCAGGSAPPPGLGLPCAVTSPQGQSERLGYDALGRVTRVERPASGYLETRSFALAGPGSPGQSLLETRIVRSGADDLVIRQYLDGLSRVHREESPSTRSETVIVDRTYDDRGRLRTESLPHFEGTSLLRTFAYDPIGRPTLVIDPDATTRHGFSYEPWTVVGETYFGSSSSADRVERTERGADGLGRLVRIVSHEDAANLTRPIVVTAKYDPLDQLYEVRDPIVNVPSPCASSEVSSVCTTQDHVTEIFWDTLGRRVRIDDPDSGIWRFGYDDSGLLVSRTQNAGTSASRTELRRYDALGRLASKSFAPTGMGAANARFLYDDDASSPSFAQLVAVISTGSGSTNYLYGYDAAGRRNRTRQRTAGVELESRWEYDELDRVNRRVFPDGDAFEYVHDGLRLREIRADSSNQAFTGSVLRHAGYDALGRIESLEIGQSSGGSALVTQTYGYDPSTARLSRIAAVVGSLSSSDPDGDRVAASSDMCPNAYDPDQRDRGGLGDSSPPDGIGDGCQCGDVDGTGNVTYADALEIVSQGWSAEPLARPDLCDVDGGGACDPYDFVAVLMALWHESGDLQHCRATIPANLPSSEPMDLEVAFDGLGRLVSQSGALGAEPVSRSYTYDGLSRLSTATGTFDKARGVPGPVTWTYSYDVLGNLIRRSSSRPESSGGSRRTWSYAHPTKPHFLSEFDESGGPWESIRATAGGEVESIDLGPGYARETFTWNALGKLHRHHNSSYSYDAFGELTLTVTGAVDESTSIITVGRDYEYDVGARRANKYFSVGGVRIASLATSLSAPNASVSPATLTSGPGRYGRHAEPILAHLTDHLGTIRASVNQDGIVVETRDYDPFGESISHEGAFSIEHRFTGQPQDDQARGLYNYGARFYNPRWGRFISPDEVAQSFDSQGLNPYSYVLNRPTSLVDPTGRFAGVSAPYGNTIALLGGSNPTYATERDPSSSKYDKEVRADVWNTPLADMVAEMRLADADMPPLPMVLKLTQIVLVDFHACALGTFAQFVFNPFMSVGKLADRALNGDVIGMGGAAQRLIEGTLVPHYGLQNGPYWGRGRTSNGKLESVLDEAGFVHDGLCSPRCTNDADREWIRIAWSDPWRLGPYGQIYRLVGTAAFSARIAWRSMTGQP